MDTERSWTEDYYDAMMHYAWAPEDLDHRSIRRRKDEVTRTSPYQTVERLRHIEIPFNHILAFFFTLAPSRVVTDLFNHHVFNDHVGVCGCGEVELLGRQIEYESVTQPDFVFKGDHAFLTIETKITSKTSIEQLQKYAFLHAVAESKQPGRIHGLMFLAPYPKEQLFREKFESWIQIKHRAAEDLEEIKRGERPAPKYTIKKIAESDAAIEFLKAPEKLKIGYCSFKQLNSLVQKFYKRTIEGTVDNRLYRGLMAEIGRRMTYLDPLGGKTAA